MGVRIDGACLHTGLSEGPLVEGVLVENDDAAAPEIADIGDESGGVEGHEHVAILARRPDFPGAEMHLIGRHTVNRSRRRPDLCREFRQGEQFGAAMLCGAGKLQAGELDAVAGIAGKARNQSVTARSAGSLADRGHFTGVFQTGRGPGPDVGGMSGHASAFARISGMISPTQTQPIGQGSAQPGCSQPFQALVTT